MTSHESVLLCGRYLLEKLVGEGATAQVYRAFDQDRQAPVAIKLVRSDQAADPYLLRRFHAEAEALEALDHPSIVRLYAFDEADGRTFLVMDYVAGTTLRDYLAMRRGPLVLREASRIVRELCGALYYAHRKGIVHQDLKPGNVILTPDGRAVLTDFGIAHGLGRMAASHLTMGTPAYIDPRADTRRCAGCVV